MAHTYARTMRTIFIKKLLYIISADKTIINSMKKSEKTKIVDPEVKKRKKRRIAIALSVVFLLPLVVASAAIGGFAIWANTQKPNKDLLPTASATPVFFDSSGNELPYTEENYIAIDDIPDNLKNAFVALEDKRFYSHKGYDPVRMAGALINNIKSGALKEGASTITQQLVKNTHLTHEKTVGRKLKEIAIATNIEKEYSKDEILAMYLSVIYFGNGAYGVKQAARLYFDKNIQDLTLPECATLAGIVKNPKKYSPFATENACISRRNLVLSVMKKEGYIDESTYNTAINAPLESTKNQQKSGNLNKRIYDLYIKSAIAEVCEKLDMTKYELSNSGLKIYLNVDSEMQKQIAKIGSDKSLYSTDEINGAIIVLDNQSHTVSAYWSNLPYDVKRQAGSSLKPLAVYAPALDKNAITLATPIVDEKVVFGDYSPSNYGGIYYGDTTIRQAIKKSMNSVSVKTLDYIGVDSSIEYLDKLGINTSENDKNYALSLGAISNGVGIKQIADAYATFANSGIYQCASFVDYVVKGDRKILSQSDISKNRVFKQSTCDQINSALSDTVKDGTAITLSALNFEVCAKTGTAERNDGKNGDAWCASYNDQYTVVVWHGSDSGMSEKGGGFATKQCLESWKTLESSRLINKQMKKSDSTFTLDVDLYATKRNKSVMIASENTPIEYRKTEIFSNEQIYPMSSCFDCVPKDKADFEAKYIDGKVTISLPCEEIYTYKITKCDVFGETTISQIDGKTSNGNITVFDAPYAFSDIVRYKVECFVTSNPFATAYCEKDVYVGGDFSFD